MKIAFITLGCKVNQYESEKIAKELSSCGYECVFGFDTADIYVLNTCSVTAESDKKSRQMIAKINKYNADCSIIVCGCSSQNDSLQYLNKKNVVKVYGISDKFELIAFIQNKYKSNNLKHDLEFRTRKYLKIQDGCNNFCSYCIIPYLRGREHSRAIKDIVLEAKSIEKTCQEIVLTGINMSAYGKDIGESLTSLLVALKDIKARIRLGSLEVNVIDQVFLDACKNLNHFCPHFHLSMQSGSNIVLKSMNRHYTTDAFEQKVQLIRNNFDSPFIACDLIIGFPTESEECFQETVQFLHHIQFSYIHYFPYSKRQGTVASKIYNELSPSTLKGREKIICELNNKYKNLYLQSKIGAKVEVLIEKVENGISSGYSKEYIKCYYKAVCNVGDIETMFISEIYKDGALVTKI